MRIALYARVSTRNKDQNPETQLLRLRQFVSQHPDGQVAKTYIDQASANDLFHRTAWRNLQDDAIHRFPMVNQTRQPSNDLLFGHLAGQQRYLLVTVDARVAWFEDRNERNVSASWTQAMIRANGWM